MGTRLMLWCWLLLAGPLWGEQFVFVDDIITWTKNGYDYPRQRGPLNWVTPVNYRDGRIYARYEILSQPGSGQKAVQLCMWQDSYTLESCAACQTATTTKLYYFDYGTPSSWWKKGGVSLDWTRAFGAIYLMHKKQDCSGSLLMTSACGTSCYTGTDIDSWAPIQFKILIVAVSQGATFQPPEGWNTPLTVAAPQFSPPPGTYTGRQNVTLTSATADAELYWTMLEPEGEPTVSSRPYQNYVPILATRTIKAVAYKHCTYSPVVTATYVINTTAANSPALVLPEELGLTVTPHPFRRDITLSFVLEQPADATLEFCTLRGQLLQTRVLRHLPAGRHACNWDGRDAAAAPVPPGVYLYRLRCSDGTWTQGRLLKTGR